MQPVDCNKILLLFFLACWGTATWVMVVGWVGPGVSEKNIFAKKGLHGIT